MKTCLSLTSLAAFSLLWLSSAQNTTAAGLTPAPTSANNTAGSLKSQAQVETATAVGTISSTGNAKVTLTSANIDAGTPLVFLVAVTSGDTSSVWADKVRLALSADLQVAELFEVGGTGGAITLKRKPQLEGEGVSYYAANDSTLNLALDNDTATGITTATSSEDTTAGFLASTAQVETATADGTITNAGNARVIVTAAGLPGSPKAYTVPVLLNDAASAWATKVRTALIADSSLTSLYDVGVSGTSITLTRKKVSIVSGKDIFAVNDPTLNINIDNNTCAGIIPQSISSNTTAGTLQNAGQVETATALGAVTTPGNLQVVVTSDTLLQKPSTTPLEINGKWTAKKLIDVPVLAGDSTSAWAVKVRTALNADADVSNLFTASGTGSKIVLSRKADNVSPGLSIFADNDPTLNLALVTGSKGILPKLTSTNTTAGELASVAQVEIATAAGTINTNGTLEVVVTAAGLPGSPKSINVPVLAGDAATNWAAKVRTVLNADSDITNLFVVGGAGESIQLTSKLMVTLDGVDIYPVNDPTLNIALVIDSDGDKLADFDEIYVHLTDPKKADTDDDGFTDFTEVQVTPPSDPKDPNSKPPFTPPTYYDKSQYVDQVDVKISQPYTPFGNRLEFNRYGDDGSKCVLDANGVLTWIGNKGEVRLLPDSSKAIPLFVTNTECLVWVNRFVDYNTYPDRPDAQLRLYRSTPESNEVTSQDVSFQGKEIIATPQVTTTTGTLTFVSATRKDNGDETDGGDVTFNYSDDCELRFYRLTFDGGVQFIGSKTVQIKNADNFDTNTNGPEILALGYGSDGSMTFKVINERVQPQFKGTEAPDYEDRTYWIDNQGRFLRVVESQATLTAAPLVIDAKPCSRVLFVSNTRLVYEHSTTAGVTGIQEQRRSSSTGNLMPSSIKDLTASVKGTTLDIWNYSQVGVNRYFYTVNTSDEVAGAPDDTGTIIRTYRVTSNGLTEVTTTTLTGGLTISPATMTGTVNTTDGSALLAVEDGDALIWLHAAGYTALPNSSKASALFVTNDQAVIWENAKAPVGGNGQIPNAIVKHYKQVGTVATTIRTDGNKTLLNTSRLTPDPEYWFFTTAIKTDASTSRLTTYKLGTIEIANVDTDNDGLLDYYELFPVAPNPVTDPTNPDTDADGLKDGPEIITYSTDPTLDDTDGDTLLDGDEVNNYFTNPLLVDTDDDSLNDDIELFYNTDPLKKDTDGDALEDDDEISLGTDPRLTDTDGDNLTDGNEIYVHFTDPNDSDTDGDTLDDDKEVLVHLTDPNDPDSDGDSLPDAEEVSKGTDPNNDQDPIFIDTDKDNLTNFDEIYVHFTDPKKADTDGDGINDDVEITGGGDPLDAESDTDGDGLKDRVETRTGIFVSATNTGTDPYDMDKDTDNDGLLDNVETGTGAYVSLSNTGTNPNVPDTDGDGLSDKIEIDFTSSPFVFDTDNDLASDADEYNATPRTNPRDPSDYPSAISRPEGLHAVVRSLGEQQVSIDETFAPFGHRPERDKVGDDGSTAIIDRNGVLIWSDKDGQTFTIPNSSLAKTLFISNSECIVYNNRFKPNSYNSEKEEAEIIIHRRGPNGIVSKTININGTLLDTAPVTATTYGFTILSGKRLDDGKESRQITLEQSNNNGVITTTEKVEEKDIWDILNLTLYQITWDGLLKQLDWDSIPIPGGDVGINFHGSPQIKASGSDGSIIVEMRTGDEFVDRYDDPEPGVFLSKLTCHWITLTANQESIEALPGVFSDALYVDNDRALLERLVDGSNTTYEIVDYRQRAVGGSRVASTFPLPAGERTLPLGAYSIRGLSPYIYTLNAAGNSLKLYRADAKITPLGAAVALPVAIEPSSVMIRNPRDASLLIKTEDSGLLWVPTTTNGTSSAVTGFATPKFLPGTAQGKPLYVKADEAVAWLNSEAVPLNGVLPAAQVSHFQLGATGLVVGVNLSSWIEGKYVMVPQQLSPDPDLEGWYITTFEKTSATASKMRKYRLELAADADRDDDGISDYLELVGFYNDGTPTDFYNPDTDGDGLSDGRELLPFEFINDFKTWEEARLAAIAKGGRLAVLDDLQTPVLNPTMRSRLLAAIGAKNVADARYWIGGHDTITEGQILWLDKVGDIKSAGINGARQIVYNDYANAWDQFQPSNVNNADGLQISKASLKWSMAPIANKQGYVIQYPKTNPNDANSKNDSDGDGLPDIVETNTGTFVSQTDRGTDPADKDTDDDTLPDNVESGTGIYVSANNTGTDPNKKDSDGDGFFDNEENNSGVFVSATNPGTDPNATDTDGDGRSDWDEAKSVGGFFSNPLRLDTDGDLVSDFDEVNAGTPPGSAATDPNNPSSYPKSGITPLSDLHTIVRSLGEPQSVAIDQSFAPFGHRPDRDKIGDDGSAVMIDRNGVLIWIDKEGKAITIPGSSQAKTLFVSNTECVVYKNRYSSDYNLSDTKAQLAIYRRNGSAQIISQINPEIRGTIIDTCPITPTTYGFNLIYGTHIDIDGRSIGVMRFQLARLTWNGDLQPLAASDVQILKASQVVDGNSAYNDLPNDLKLNATGSDGSMIFSLNADPNIDFAFKPKATMFWVSTALNQDAIIALSDKIPAAAASRAAYVDNGRVIVSRPKVGVQNVNQLLDLRYSDASGLTEASVTDLPEGDSILNVGAYSTQGLVPYIYTINAEGNSLSLWEASGAPKRLLNAVTLPTKVQVGSTFVRNPRDGSLLIESDDSGLIWIPTILTDGKPTGLGAPRILPNTMQGSPLFVSHQEAVAWLNTQDPPLNGSLSPAKIAHYQVVGTRLTATDLTPPIEGKYLALPSFLTPDPELEGWYLTSFEKDSPTSTILRRYRLDLASNADRDNDGLTDYAELRGDFSKKSPKESTDPWDPDTDDDGLSDGRELMPFEIVTTPLGWEAARLAAIAKGGKLAVLNSLDQQNRFRVAMLAAKASGKFWVGGHDVIKEASGTSGGKYQWLKDDGALDGIEIGPPTKWQPSQPNNLNDADGMEVSGDADFKWAMAPVSRTQAYVIEYPLTNPNVKDTDTDGLDDNKEILVHLTDPTKADTDGDLISDAEEVSKGTDPKNDKDPKAIDTDKDNLTNFDEIYTYITDPKRADTDGDGLNDDLEVLTHFTDPNVMDTDDDGFTDFVEVTATPATDPNDASSTPPYTPLAAYNKSQFVNQIDVKIPQPYTPFGNRPEFNRFGDDGSKCVLDANGVLTWVGNKGEVRLLPNTSKAIPLFVTNTECLVWVNRFVDYSTYPERPNAQLRLYRSTPGSTQVSFQDVSFEGKEIIDTPQVTTTTGTLTFVSATRKDNGDETPGPNNFSDDCELRFYRLTFDAGVQFVGTRIVQIKNVEDFETNAVGPEIQALGYGSDGSMAIKVMNERVQPGFKNSGTPDYEGRTYWIDNQGRFVRVIEDQLYLTNNTLDPKPCSRVLFMSNTRMVYEHTTTAGVIGIQEQRRSSSNGNLLPASTKDLTASVTGTTLDIWNYSQVGTPRYFYTVNTTDEVAGTPDDKGTIIRTYRVNSDGVSFVRQATLLGGLTISPAAATGTVNAQDGSALLVSEDGDALIWLHAAGYTNLPNSSRASALFVTDQQAVIWENGKAPVGEDGKIPPAVVMHYNRAALSATPANITSASQVGTTVSLQIKNHGFAVGDSITITGLTGTTPANGTFVVASVTSPNNLTYRLNTSQTATFGVGAARSNYSGTRIVTDGNTVLLNTSRLTPTNPEFWLFTTATKTDASTSRLVTYRLGTVEIKNPTIDSDGDGVTDNDELNIYNTDPLATDSDGDGLSDLTELLVLFSNANDPVGTGFMTPSVPDENANNSSYEGLLYSEQTGLVGKVTFNVTGTTTKSFTGTYQDIYGISSPLQGTFDGSGELATFSSSLELDLADINIVLQKQPNNKYHIHLAINTGANGMQYAKARPALDTYAPLRSKLTFEAKLSNAESVPSGAAIATGTLTTAAEANFQIYLPDGSTSAYAGKILDGEIIALHTKSASTGAPSFLGNLKLDNRSNQISNLSGATRLFSDASDYDQVRELTGSYYQVPLTTSLPLSSFTPGTSNSVFGWSQGELGGAYQVVSWTPIGITPPTTAYDSMTPTPTFTPSTGLMKVDYIRSDRDRNLYQDKSTAWAVVNQGRSTVNGFYTGSAGRNWVGGSFSVIPNTTRLTPPDVPLPPEPPIIPGIVSSITPTSKSVGAALSTYEITVNGTDNWQVEIPETAPWISAEVVSNDGSTWADKLTGRGSAKITVTVQANDDFSNREAVIKIGNLEKGYLEHKITQSAGTVTSINPTSMQAVTEGNAYTIRVLATGTWRAVVSTPAWIKAEVVNDNGFVPAATGTGGGTGAASNLVGQGNATINVTIDPNATPNMRTGSILIGDKTHSVTQRPVFLAGTVTSISSTSRNVAATASTYTFRVTGKDNWRTVVTGGSWLKAEVINDDGYVAAGNLTGSGNATIKVTVAANSTVNRRTGTIKVGDKVHTVVQAPIIERGSVTSINPTKRDVRAAQTSYTIRVTGVKNWTISIPASSSWIKVKVVNDNRFIYAAAPNVTGSGNATIQVTVATNATNKRRTGTINIGGKIHTINQAFR